MEGEESNASSQTCKMYVRPEWPCEDWKCIEKELERKDIESCPPELDDKPSDKNKLIQNEGGDRTKAGICNITARSSALNIQSMVELTSENDELLQVQATQFDEVKVFEPDHWADDLSVPLDEEVPLCQLLRFMEPELYGPDGIESQQIYEEMNIMMRKISEKLESCYIVFERCYVIPVGSMAENTKIGKADEFDYVVVLPYFEHFDKLFPIIFEKDESLLYDDPAYIALANDIAPEGNTKEVQENFQSVMKVVWSLYVADFIPEGWELSELNCRGQEQSIARTFHLTRLSDGFIADIDICFWLPIHKTTLEEKSAFFEQKDYLLENCLDREMMLYAILPKDRNICDALNKVRFALSLKEREELNKYGPQNGRIKCFKLAKCVAQCFVPTLQKEGNCSRCRDRLVSSFALKNVVFFMARNYPNDEMWTDDQLGNRVSELFTILNFCMKVNCSEVSAFFVPYIIQCQEPRKKYNAAKGLLVDKNDFDEPWGKMENNCYIPKMNRFQSLFTEDLISKKVLQNYFGFLHESDWCVSEIFDRLNEMLTALREKDDLEREQYAENPGCLSFSTEVTSA